MRTEQEADRTLGLYADMVTRVCMVYLHNVQDAEDVFQEVFLKYVQFSDAFQSDEHEKAWFLRVAINGCKDLLRSAARKRTIPVSQMGDGETDTTALLEHLLHQQTEADDQDRDVLGAVLSLEEKYREAIYLHYYEGYTAPEIGAMTGRPANTVYSLLKRGREMLRKNLEEEHHG